MQFLDFSRKMEIRFNFYLIKLALVLMILSSIAENTRADQLSIVTTKDNKSRIETIDTRSDNVIGRIYLRDRVMPIRNAIRLQSAIPWGGPGLAADDLISKQKAGAKTAAVDAYPNMITVADGYLYGAIGDGQPSFVYEIRLSSGHALYHDIFERHAAAVHAVKRRVFVSDFRDGVSWADPLSGRAHPVDDRYDRTIRFRQFVSGDEQPDTAMQRYAEDMRGHLMHEWCINMTTGQGGKTLYVACRGANERPMLFIVDVAKAKLIETLNLGTEGDAGIRDLETGNDGTVYAAVLGDGAKTLSLYRLDALSGKVAGRTDIDLRSLAADGKPDGCGLAIGGDRLFLTLGNRLMALALADPSQVVAAVDLADRPIDIVATRDGRKVYVHQNGVVPVTLTEDNKLILGEPLRLDGEAGLMAIDKSGGSASGRR